MTAPRDTEAGSDPTQQPSGDQDTAVSPPAAATQDADQAPREPAQPRREEPRNPDAGPGWAEREQTGRSTSPVSGSENTTVLPSGARRPPAGRQPAPAARPAAATSRPTARPLAGRSRRARLTLRRIDPWSVFLFSLVASVFIGIALVVAVAVMYAVLGSLGVTESLNELYVEVTGGDITTDALLTSGRIIGGAAVLAAVNVVFLTLLATLSALLYNLCSSFTGGIELTFGERD